MLKDISSALASFFAVACFFFLCTSSLLVRAWSRYLGGRPAGGRVSSGRRGAVQRSYGSATMIGWRYFTHARTALESKRLQKSQHNTWSHKTVRSTDRLYVIQPEVAFGTYTATRPTAHGVIRSWDARGAGDRNRLKPSSPQQAHALKTPDQSTLARPRLQANARKPTLASPCSTQQMQIKERRPHHKMQLCCANSPNSFAPRSMLKL